MGMALRGPCFTSAERNAEDFAFARELALPISLHVGMAGTSDAVTTLERFDLLGSDVNYAHCNMLTDEEFDLIAASRGTLSITASTDMLMQFGTYPGTGRALGRGIVSGWAWTPSVVRGRICSPKCAWLWPRNAHGPTQVRWPAGSGSERWISTSVTCCDSPPSKAPECGFGRQMGPNAQQAGRHHHRGHALTAS